MSILPKCHWSFIHILSLIRWKVACSLGKDYSKSVHQEQRLHKLNWGMGAHTLIPTYYMPNSNPKILEVSGCCVNIRKRKVYNLAGIIAATLRLTMTIWIQFPVSKNILYESQTENTQFPFKVWTACLLWLDPASGPVLSKELNII